MPDIEQLASREKPVSVTPRKKKPRHTASSSPHTKATKVDGTSRKNIARIGAVAAVGILLLVISFFMTRKSSDIAPVLTSRATSGSQTPLSVAAPGLVEARRGTFQLAFEIAGKIRRVLVEEGQVVKQGDVLAELVNDEQQAHLALAEADLKVTQADFETLKGELKAEALQGRQAVARTRAEWQMLKAGPRVEEVEHARAMVNAAEAEWKRRVDDAKRYLDPTIASEQQRELSKGQADVTAAELAAARAKLRELEAGTRAEEIDRAQAMHLSMQADLERTTSTTALRLDAARGRIEQARARVALARSNLDKTKLLAPLDGVVVWKYRHAGESVGMLPPEAIIAVADPKDLRVRADVDEQDYARISKGMRTRIRAEAFGDKDFLGTVTLVGAAAGQKRFSTGEAKEKQDVKVVETLITFDQPPPFKLGLRVTVYFDAK